MISTDNIEKFNKVVAYYQLDQAQLRDVAKAVCIADYLHGTDPQKLSPARLDNSGIDTFNGVSAVKSNAKPLPDVQVMRVICDTLFYGIYIKHKKLVKGTRLTNACSSYVGTELQVNNSPVMRAETNEYFDIDECQRILDSFVDSCIADLDFNPLVDVMNKYANKMNVIFSYYNIYKVNRNLQDVQLPQSIRADLDKRIKTDCFKFVPDKDFTRMLNDLNLSISNYCDLVSDLLVTTTCQNIVSNLEKIENINNPLCCTACIKITRILDGDSIYLPIEKKEDTKTCIYTSAKTPLLRKYYDSFFTRTGVKRNSYDLVQLDTLVKLSTVLIKLLKL